MKCPHCGAENADRSSFCSLCLGRFSLPDRPGAMKAGQSPQMQAPPPQQYVSPGDYRSLANDMYRNPTPTYAPINNYVFPGTPLAVPVERTGGKAVLLLIKHSLLWFLVLLGFLIGVGGIISSLEHSGMGDNLTAWGLTRIILIGVMVLTFITAGYRIADEAREPKKGWIYGLACVSVITIVWLTLFLYLILLWLAHASYIWLTDLSNLLTIFFLYLPLGALGGWIADKRNFG
jgi:zinc-ribbon domain